MASLEKTVRTILQKAYCMDLDTFLKVLYGREPGKYDQYHLEKYHKMRNNFIQWFCELDEDIAEQFCQYSIKDLIIPMGEYEENHENIKCCFNNNSLLELTFPHDIDSNTREVMLNIVSENISDYDQIYFEDNRRMMLLDVPRTIDLKSLCSFLINTINKTNN